MKTIIALILVVMMLFFCACGQASAPEEPATATTLPATTEPPTATTFAAAVLAPLLHTAQGQKLSLPAHSNNGGPYVYHDGATYYRQYNASCFEAAFGWQASQPLTISGAVKQMMRMDDSGAAQVLFEDDGNGGIFIDSSGNFYLRREIAPERDQCQIYSLDKNGKQRWQTDSESYQYRIFAMDDSRGILICAEEYFAKTISAIDCADGSRGNCTSIR